MINDPSPEIHKNPLRVLTTNLYKRADMEGLHDHLARFRESFLSSDHCHISVKDVWVSFKSEVLLATERFIPTKMYRA